MRIWGIISICSFFTLLTCDANDDYVDAQNNHALEMLLELSQGGDNFSYSPYSESKLMTMMYSGSNKETYAEISEHFKFEQNLIDVVNAAKVYNKSIRDFSGKGSGVSIITNNSIWVQDGFPIAPHYTTNLKENFSETKFTLIDFFEEPEKSRKEINSWIQKQGRNYKHDAISKDLIKPTDRMIPINTLSFKGQWESPFIKKDTKSEQFWISENDSRSVPMMHAQGKFAYYKNDMMQIIELPYRNNNFYMTVILPANGHTFKDIEGMITMDTLNLPPKTPTTLIDVKLPRFKTASSLDITKTLQKIGIKKAFNPKEADFTKISVFKGIFINHFIHRTSISVNENRKNHSLKSSIDPNKQAKTQFNANRPFFYFIREREHGGILLAGCYSGEPSTRVRGKSLSRKMHHQ